MRLKDPLFPFFWYCETFFRKDFVFKWPPFDFIEVPLVISGVKRYIRIFDVISELYYLFFGGGGGPKTGVSHENVLHIFQICAF